MKKTPKPRPTKAWASMDVETRKVTGVYPGETKQSMWVHLMANEIAVKVQIQPLTK